MATAMQQPSPAQVAQNNSNMRQALLATALSARKNIGSYTSQAGQTTRIKLFNVGILTKIQLAVTAALTIGTAVAVPSAKAPWNLINRIRLTDYDNTDRVNLSGFQLFVLNCVRRRQYYGYNNSPANTAVFTNPVVPTAIGNGTLSFIIDVPVAFDIDNPVSQLRDTRGVMLMQTAVGECYLTIDWITSLIANNDVDSLYSGGGTTTVVGNGANYIGVTVYQEYLLPQAVGGNGFLPIPPVDINTVYELNGFLRSTDNFAVGQEKLISYPNVRSVVGGYLNFINNGALSIALSQLRLIANGNTVILDHSANTKLFEQRLYMQEDGPVGAFMFLHRDKPIETALFGNVQLGITPSAALTLPSVEILWESFYTKGSALPGMTQSST